VALQQLVTVYLARVTTSPAGVAFGPILGLLVFTNVVARLVLSVTAWAATLHENAPKQVDEPAPVVVRPAFTMCRPPAPRVAAALSGAGAALGAFLGAVNPVRGRRHRARRGGFSIAGAGPGSSAGERLHAQGEVVAVAAGA
jgi:membrane protein